MADAVSNVIRTAVQIRRMCERAKACRALVDVVERKMASLIPVMAEIQDHLEEMDTTAVMHLTTALAKDIRECRAIVQRASTMSKISYIVHSNDLREQIERNLRAIHLALMSLQASQNTYLIHQNQRLADEFRKFHLAWQQREKELRREKERESRLKARVAKSLEECNQRGASDEVRRQSVARAAGITVSQVKWLERELAHARADHDRLVAKMKRDKDSVTRSKAKADAMLMDQIITALAINESLDTSQGSLYINLAEDDDTPIEQSSDPLPPEEADTQGSRNLPEDCFCPITNQVMDDPVIVDANCHHTVSRYAADQWFGLGKTTCPVCGIEVESHHVSPNVQLRNVTESLLSDGLYTDKPKPRITKSTEPFYNNCLKENIVRTTDCMRSCFGRSSQRFTRVCFIVGFSFFVMLWGGITLSIITLCSCSFLDSGVLGARQSGVGLYRYVDEAGSCVVYPDDFSFTTSDKTARVFGLMAPIFAFCAGVLYKYTGTSCCNLCRHSCINYFFFFCAQISQIFTFFMFNGSFCTVGFDCSLSIGSYNSLCACICYFVSGAIFFFSSKLDPLCCKNEDAGGETHDEEDCCRAVSPETIAYDIESAIPGRGSTNNDEKSKHHGKERIGLWGNISGDLWKGICTPPIVGAIAIWCLVLGSIMFGLFSVLVRMSTNEGIQGMKVFGLVILCLGGILPVAYMCGKLIVDRYLDRIEPV